MKVGREMGISNPIRRTSSLEFAQDCESYCISLFLSRYCPRSHNFVVHTVLILLTSNQIPQIPTLIVWRQIWNPLYLTSVLQCYLIWSHIIVAMRWRQRGIFFNFLGHKNEVYRKSKPLQEKVKYTISNKLYYRVSRKKNQLKKSTQLSARRARKGVTFWL